jgi:hypothetical protein
LHGLPETLPHESISYWTIPLGNGTHILACGVAKGSMVGRGYISYRGKDCKGESDEEEGGAEL